MLKVVVVDNQKTYQSILQELLLEYTKPIEVVGQAIDAVTGIHLIHQFQPDVVILNTEMPYYSGFQLLDFFEAANFSIIFTTHHKEHALKALKANALAYLIQPIEKELLFQAIDKAIVLKEAQLANVVTKSDAVKIAFPSVNGWLYFYEYEISFLESKGKETLIHLANGKTLSTTFGLKECQLLLEKTSLVRVHRSYMVNLRHIKRYVKGGERFLTLKDDSKIDVGKMYKEDLNKIVSFFPK